MCICKAGKPVWFVARYVEVEVASKGEQVEKRAKGAHLWRVLSFKRNASSRVGQEQAEIRSCREERGRAGSPGGTCAGAQGGWNKASLMEAEGACEGPAGSAEPQTQGPPLGRSDSPAARPFTRDLPLNSVRKSPKNPSSP